MSDDTKRHEKSAELIAASNAYYRRFASKLLDLRDEPTADEKRLAELLVSELSPKNRLEAAKLLRKKTIRADVLHHCLKQATRT